MIVDLTSSSSPELDSTREAKRPKLSFSLSPPSSLPAPSATRPFHPSSPHQVTKCSGRDSHKGRSSCQNNSNPNGQADLDLATERHSASALAIPTQGQTYVRNSTRSGRQARDQPGVHSTQRWTQEEGKIEGDFSETNEEGQDSFLRLPHEEEEEEEESVLGLRHHLSRFAGALVSNEAVPRQQHCSRVKQERFKTTGSRLHGEPDIPTSFSRTSLASCSPDRTKQTGQQTPLRPASLNVPARAPGAIKYNNVTRKEMLAKAQTEIIDSVAPTVAVASIPAKTPIKAASELKVKTSAKALRRKDDLNLALPSPNQAASNPRRHKRSKRFQAAKPDPLDLAIVANWQINLLVMCPMCGASFPITQSPATRRRHLSICGAGKALTVEATVELLQEELARVDREDQLKRFRALQTQTTWDEMLRDTRYAIKNVDDDEIWDVLGIAEDSERRKQDKRARRKATCLAGNICEVRDVLADDPLSKRWKLLEGRNDLGIERRVCILQKHSQEPRRMAWLRFQQYIDVGPSTLDPQSVGKAPSTAVYATQQPGSFGNSGLGRLKGPGPRAGFGLGFHPEAAERSYHRRHEAVLSTTAHGIGSHREAVPAAASLGSSSSATASAPSPTPNITPVWLSASADTSHYPVELADTVAASRNYSPATSSSSPSPSPSPSSAHAGTLSFSQSSSVIFVK